MMGLDFAGEVFDDRFLIADVKMTADFPTERWFWFQPPFHGGQSALLHKQPDDVWRIDLQLGRDADAEAEKRPENVVPRIRRMLGHDAFSLEWVSVYTFQCRRLERFVHGRVIFAGDAAHQVSPFGARGANSGIQDAENLAWKLALVLRGRRGRISSPPTTPSGAPRPTRTSATPPAPPTSSRRPRRASAGCATLSWRSRHRTLRPPPRQFRAAVDPHHLRHAALDAGRRGLVRHGPSSARRCPTCRSLCLLAGRRTSPHSPAAGSCWWRGEVGEAPTSCDLLVVGRDVLDGEGLFATRFDATPGACFLLRPGRASDGALAPLRCREGRGCDPPGKGIPRQGLGPRRLNRNQSLKDLNRT
jgi:3-(3-hydroxy-phenyl)propionate hydroxylase